MRGIVLVLALLGSASPAFAADLAGDWYGEGYQPLWHDNAQWLMHLSPDGTYAIEFRQYHDCRLTLNQKESGSWDLSDTYRMVATSVNGIATHYETDYRIVSRGDDEFRIVHVATGQEYIEKRVAPNFSFPAPDCVTS